ncbi:aminoimidazole riboside kinase [Bacillus sp. DJP31]|uniref:aminoimidazole riboside kinase n=1 Tax=Bacillus sp. DJP31 TaxID=3409789 RepID=UPI003BB7FC2A
MLKGVISLGEALIDFIPQDSSNLTYEKCPGGAPANVAVGVARLGGRSSFLGKVGNDVLGDFLIKTLDSYGVSVEAFSQTDEAKTGIVFVTNSEDGDRSFSFFIDRSADQLLHEKDVDQKLFKEHNILHFGSISMIHEPVRSATLKAIQLAKENGLLISYDPNLRLGLWKSREKAKEVIVSLLHEADFLKISDEELHFITGETNIQEGLVKLESYNIPLVLVTLGADGSVIHFKGDAEKVRAMKVNAVDTTGAGDAFVSAMLYQMSQLDVALTYLKLEDIVKMVKFASISGGLAASVKGAMTALPTKEEVVALLK